MIEAKQTDKLIEAVLGLEKRLTSMTKKSSGVGEMIKDKIGINDISVRNVAQFMGVKPNGIIDTLLAGREEKQDILKEEAAKAHTFAKTRMQFTAQGQAEAKESPALALKNGVKLYKERELLSEKIKILEKEDSKRTDAGIESTSEQIKEIKDLKEKYHTFLTEKTERIQEVTKPVATAKVEAEKVEPEKVEPEKVEPEKVEPEKVKAEKVKAEKTEPARTNETILPESDGALLDINKAQLKELQKLVEISKVSEEQTLEARVKPNTDTVKIEQDKKSEPESKGLLSSILGTLTSIGGSIIGAMSLANVVSKIAPVLSTVAAVAGPLLSKLGPAAAVAGAGVAGYQFGKHVVNPLLNKAAESITGNKGETVGTAIYEGVDKVQSIFGLDDKSKQTKTERNLMLTTLIKKLEDKKPMVPVQMKYLASNQQHMTSTQLKTYMKLAPGAVVVEPGSALFKTDTSKTDVSKTDISATDTQRTIDRMNASDTVKTDISANDTRATLERLNDTSVNTQSTIDKSDISATDTQRTIDKLNTVKTDISTTDTQRTIERMNSDKSVYSSIAPASTTLIEKSMVAMNNNAFETSKLFTTNSEKVASIIKEDQTQREMQTNNLIQVQKNSDSLTIQKEKAMENNSSTASNIVTNNVVNNNNNIKQVRVIPPVRNIEPSLNKRLNATFV